MFFLLHELLWQSLCTSGFFFFFGGQKCCISSLLASTRSSVDSLTVHQTRCALTTATFAETPHSTDMSHNSWSKPVTAAHPFLFFLRASTNLIAGGIWIAELLLCRFLSHRTRRFFFFFFMKTPGYELWAFSSLMNRASNAGDRGDSLISVSRWQIFIEFWTEISLYFLPWITEILAPMAPVYEGKLLFLCGCVSVQSLTGPTVAHQLRYNWIAADTEGRDALHPLVFLSYIQHTVYLHSF